MKNRYSMVFAAMLSFILVAFPGLDAAMALMLEMTTPELTRQAQAIVRGTVKDMRSEWDPDRRFIWTLVSISVSLSIKGDREAGQEVIVKIPGGVVGQVGQVTEDTPIFKKGEDVLLFLKPVVYRGKKIFRVTGNFQGKHTIKDNMVIEKRMPLATFLGHIKGAMQNLKGHELQ
jgi:hypothetical protein